MKRVPLLRKTGLKACGGFAAMSAVGARKKCPQKITSAITGAVKAVAIRAGLRRKKAKAATVAEKRRWADALSRGCVACYINETELGRTRASYGRELEIHHLLSGGRRIGHSATVCLCHYHHQGKRLPFTDTGYKDHAVIYGASFGREPRRFREVYGSDTQLLARQNAMIRALPPRFDVPSRCDA